MTDSLLQSLLSAGPLGAVIAALGVAYWRQATDLRRVEQARVEDARRVTQTLLELSERWNDTVGRHTLAIEKLTTSVDATRRR